MSVQIPELAEIGGISFTARTARRYPAYAVDSHGGSNSSGAGLPGGLFLIAFHTSLLAGKTASTAFGVLPPLSDARRRLRLVRLLQLARLLRAVRSLEQARLLLIRRWGRRRHGKGNSGLQRNPAFV